MLARSTSAEEVSMSACRPLRDGEDVDVEDAALRICWWEELRERAESLEVVRKRGSEGVGDIARRREKAAGNGGVEGKVR